MAAIGFALALRCVLVLATGLIPVRVTTVAGQTIEGELVAFDSAAIELRQDGAPVRLSFDAVLALAPQRLNERAGPSTLVQLRGGSRIAAQSVSLTDEQLQIQPRRQQPLSVPVGQVEAIRFRAASPGVDPQWLGMLENEQRKDVLVIRRDGDRLDPVQGLIESIGDERVGFRLDGDNRVNAPIERLEGVIFGGSAQASQPAKIQLVDVYGSRWQLASLEPGPADAAVSVKLDRDIRHEIPVDQIASLRWSSGLTMLAQQSPADQSYRPYLETKVDAALLLDWFGPRVVGETDLELTGESSVSYRVAPDYQTFAGSVLRDNPVSTHGKLTVQIYLDERQVWSQTIAGAAERKGFEIPVQGANRLRIDVLTGADGDLGDTVRVIRPRLLK